MTTRAVNHSFGSATVRMIPFFGFTATTDWVHYGTHTPKQAIYHQSLFPSPRNSASRGRMLIFLGNASIHRMIFPRLCQKPYANCSRLFHSYQWNVDVTLEVYCGSARCGGRRRIQISPNGYLHTTNGTCDWWPTHARLGIWALIGSVHWAS